ncbi:AraC-like ligand-binding domain-containing protein [Rhodococcus erythropolis]|uniref:AraC-like ligand-binding domain-containing protein n=1 Tax=Rhodococcus erythropolis TaxID=1833 RepID=UPI001D176677|nr:hypothetical protein [Rhodococcus erythropolis]
MSAVSATPPSLPESVQQWHCEMSETFGGLCPESSVDAAPVGTVSGVSLGDVGAFDISGSPQILRRSARAAKRHGSDLLKICTVRTGSAILRQSDRELTAPPGAMILYDVERSYALRFDGHWSCTVMTLPRSAVSLTERELNCALERTHDGRRGSGALLGNFISGAVASQVDGSAAGLLGDAGVNLASAVLMQGSAPATPGRSTREEILRYLCKAAQILEAERTEVERWLICEGDSVPRKAAFRSLSRHLRTVRSLGAADAAVRSPPARQPGRVLKHRPTGAPRRDRRDQPVEVSRCSLPCVLSHRPYLSEMPSF